MANFLEEMAKSMKPGVRVKRRRYWNYVGIDGNSEGTFIGTWTSPYTGSLLFKVIWDCRNVEYALRMDTEIYDLQIVDFALPSTDKPLAKKGLA